MADAMSLITGGEAATDGDQGLRARVEAVLDMIRPAVQGDGGDLELIDIVEGVVQLRLVGACVGCMYSMMTLQAGVERILKQHVPEVKAVEAMPF